MSRSDKSRKPRYTGYGRPVYHQHGSRRLLVEQQDRRSAIAEQDTEPLADWERELLDGVEDLMYAEEVYDTRPTHNPFTIGFIPGTEHRPSRAEQQRLADKREEKRKADEWVASVQKRREAERVEEIRSNLRANDPAKRVTVAHRIRVTDVALMCSLTNMQTIYLLNSICKEYVKSANSTVASIVATDLERLVNDEEGGGRTMVRKVLADTGIEGMAL